MGIFRSKFKNNYKLLKKSSAEDTMEEQASIKLTEGHMRQFCNIHSRWGSCGRIFTKAYLGLCDITVSHMEVFS